jgi:hypothetical protein
MNTKKILALFIGLSMPTFSQAIPQKLACKLYGQSGSSQMSSQITDQNGEAKTYLKFSPPVFPGVNLFELVYSSGYDATQSLTLVANANSSNGAGQTIQIILDAPSSGEPTTRYGKVRSGDFMSDWRSTIGNYVGYNIQCFNF